MKATLRTTCSALVLAAASSEAFAYSSDWLRSYSQLRVIRVYADEYRKEQGRYPTEPELWAFAAEWDTGIETNFWNGFTNGVGLDPWGSPYRYEPPSDVAADPNDPSTVARVWSRGADGIDDSGAKDDISNFQGINPGYYWKRGWPLGQALGWAGAALAGLALILIPRFGSWRSALIVAGLIASGTAFFVSPLAVTPWAVGGLQNYAPWSRTAQLLGMVGLPAFGLWGLMHLQRNGHSAPQAEQNGLESTGTPESTPPSAPSAPKFTGRGGW